MTKQPEALEIASELEKKFPRRDTVRQEAAAELRRLHGEIQELVEALKLFLENGQDYTAIRDKARAALQKHGGGE